MVARQVPAAAHRPLARTGEGLDAPLGLSTLALAGALGLAALSGVVAGLALPRGPVTTGQALALLVGGLAVGGAAGALLRSRWALLLVPRSEERRVGKECRSGWEPYQCEKN